MYIKWIFVLSIITVIEATGRKQNHEDASLVDSNNRFGFDVFRSLDDRYGNLFISPWSLFTTLAMIQMGANGNTLAEMNSVLHLNPLLSQQTPSLFDELYEALQSYQGEYELNMFNAAVVQEGYNTSKSYREKLQKLYHADIYEVDFIKHGVLIKDWFNAWTKLKTGGKINEVLTSVPDPLTRLMLVSTCYFKGIWEKSFDPNKTRNATFYNNGWKEVTTPMMEIRGNFSILYTDSSDVYAVDLPMKGGISFLLVMPNKHEDFDKLEKTFSPEFLNSIKSQMMKADIQLLIPKFKADSKMDVQGVLQSLGMESLFRFPEADLSGIATSEGLYVSEVVHQVYVGVNEEGAEAAAVSTVSILTRNRIASLRFERPFWFFISDTQTGLVLFVGRVRSL